MDNVEKMRNRKMENLKTNPASLNPENPCGTTARRHEIFRVLDTLTLFEGSSGRFELKVVIFDHFLTLEGHFWGVKKKAPGNDTGSLS